MYDNFLVICLHMTVIDADLHNFKSYKHQNMLIFNIIV